jgi:hypothetical protein
MTIPPAELLKGWHPLDGVPPPEIVPDRWDGPHVGVRLVEGLRVLRRLPMNGHPREFSNAWPVYAREWADLVQYCDDPTWKSEEATERNRIRPRPSSIEISHMETVIVWPARYLREYPQLITVVQAAALARSRFKDLRWVERHLGLPGRVVRRWNRQGLDTIAAGLRRDQVPVF